MGGWLRLWVVLTLLWGILVAVIAFDDRPKRAWVESEWVNTGIEAIADAVSVREGQTVMGYQVRQELEKSFPTNAAKLRYLDQVATRPKEHQAIFSKAVAAVNQEYRLRLASLHKETVRHVAWAAAAWIGPALALLLAGFSARWVWRGFFPKKSPY